MCVTFVCCCACSSRCCFRMFLNQVSTHNFTNKKNHAHSGHLSSLTRRMRNILHVTKLVSGRQHRFSSNISYTFALDICTLDWPTIQATTQISHISFVCLFRFYLCLCFNSHRIVSLSGMQKSNVSQKLSCFFAVEVLSLSYRFLSLLFCLLLTFLLVCWQCYFYVLVLCFTFMSVHVRLCAIYYVTQSVANHLHKSI